MTYTGNKHHKINWKISKYMDNKQHNETQGQEEILLKSFGNI